ncbi:MAG: hypothetical protein ACLQDI_12500, partial [Syntrophobacteraceae bacterium]
GRDGCQCAPIAIILSKESPRQKHQVHDQHSENHQTGNRVQYRREPACVLQSEACKYAHHITRKKPDSTYKQALKEG